MIGQTRKRWVVAATAVAAALGTFAAPSHAAENLQLDARGPDVASAPLQAGAVFYVRVSGTASIWARNQWEQGGTGCGAAEASPMYPSPGTANGPVGFDAETIFGVPPGVPFQGFRCVPADFPFHVPELTSGGVQFGVDGTFAHAEPVGGPFSVPRADHTYLYRLTGTGTPVTFRFSDGPTADNYGVFRITVLTDAECQAENCTGTATAPPTQTPTQPNTPAAPAPAAKEAIGVVQVVSTTNRCTNRAVKLRLRAPKGVKLRSAVLRYGKKTVRVRGSKLKANINLKSVPKGSFKVRITMTTTRGQTIKSSRTFKACSTTKK
jgi:hypothetical protein